MKFIITFFTITFLFFSFAINGQEKNINPAFSTYWQQKVDYKMDIEMDVNTYQYKGNQSLIYYNNSPDVLDKVYYHLYFNAFQPESEMNARLISISDPDERMVNNKGDRKNPIYESRISDLKPHEIGFIKVQSLTQDGKALSYHIEGTILEVILDKPILSGENTVLEMQFLGQVPVQIRRSGRNNKEGVALSMAQWYPKMAEYDKEGWQTDPYIMREFYGVWGDFDVTIHIDKKYVLGGTGYVINPQEVGYGYENSEIPLDLPKGDQLTWHFKAPNVHDFTWAADKDYIHDQMQVKGGTTMHFLYKNNDKNKKNWKALQPLAVQTMEFYNHYIGTYPYHQYSIIQGGDGGMEYGMCTLVKGGNNFEGLLGTVVHEMGHAWFQFALATHEGKHPWMDEGFTSFVETMAMNSIKPQDEAFPFQGNYDGYFYMVSTGVEEPLTTHADRYNTNMSYSINAYYKGSVFMAQLSYLMGWENLEKTIKEYYKQWAGKHPTPQDFIRIAEKVSGLHLEWYFNEFAQTTHTIDYGIKSVINNEIIIERIGRMPMPLDIDVVYEDGSKEQFYIPLSMMRGEKPTEATVLKDWGWGFPTYTFKTDKKIKNIILDNSLYMADVNRENNIWGK